VVLVSHVLPLASRVVFERELAGMKNRASLSQRFDSHAPAAIEDEVTVLAVCDKVFHLVFSGR
jgi:hypothetical protein